MKGGACSGGTYQTNAVGSHAAAENAAYNTAQQIKCTYASSTGKTLGGKRNRKRKKKSMKKKKMRKSKKGRKSRKKRK